MVFETSNAAKASLREFNKKLRECHTIVKFWSETDQKFKYTRVFGAR